MPPPEACTSSYQPLTAACPRSSTNIAYTDQPQAAITPSDTSVSIETVPCQALRNAAR